MPDGLYRCRTTDLGLKLMTNVRRMPGTRLPPLPFSTFYTSHSGRLLRAGVVDAGSSAAKRLHHVVGGSMLELPPPPPPFPLGTYLVGRGPPSDGIPALEPWDAQSTLIILHTREALPRCSCLPYVTSAAGMPISKLRLVDGQFRDDVVRLSCLCVELSIAIQAGPSSR